MSTYQAHPAFYFYIPHIKLTLNALRNVAQDQPYFRQPLSDHTANRPVASRGYKPEEELSGTETGGHGRLLPPIIDATVAEMGPCNAEKPLQNSFYDAFLEGEDTEPQTLTIPDPSNDGKGSRPISVDTIKRNGSPANVSPRAWEKVDEATNAPSTPSTTSPLPSPVLLLPTVFVPPEATESEVMSYHQSFYNDQVSSDDEPDPESPVLIATSVNFLVPTTRPNLISITTSPFHSRSCDRDATDGASSSTRRSAKNARSSSVKNYSRPRVEKKHRRKASSMSSAHSNYSSHDLSSTSSQYSAMPPASISNTGECFFTPVPPPISPDRHLDRSATIKGARSKRNRHTFVHDRGPNPTRENKELDFSQHRMTIGYPDVGTWSRNVNMDEKHIYSVTTPQSDVPPVPPLTPTSIPIPSTPSQAGTPTMETVSISPEFHRQDLYHARTTPEGSTGTDHSTQYPYSTRDAGPDVVRVKSLRRHKRLYTSDRPQSLRSLRMGNSSHNGEYPSPIKTQSPTHQIPNNPTRKSLSFPYQHIYQPIPALASSPMDRPSSIRSMSINNNQSVTSLTHTNSTSNLSMYSFSYADSEYSGETNVDRSPANASSNKQRISRKKSMKALRETRETMVGRVKGKNFMNFGFGSWGRKNSAGSNNGGSGMTTPITPYEEGMVR